MTRILLALFLIASLSAQAEIYKWVDADGNAHFSDVKPAGKDVRAVAPERTPPASSGTAHAGAKRVTMYATSWCGYCAKARQHFQSNNIPYTEYDIERSESAKRMYDQLGGKGVPVILVGDKRLNGFSVSGFNRIYQ